MKKFIIFISVLALSLSGVQAKDYVKMQIKEMKHAQKYGTTKTVLQNRTNNIAQSNIASNIQIKDPKIMKFGDYEIIPQDKLDKKLKQDEAKYKEYEKILSKKHSTYYTTQADTEDFYKVYRIAERLIRANKLDYMSWRIYIRKDVNEANASSDGSNLVMITTSLFDTFANSDDALAMVIGHEMGHSVLGHYKRINQLNVRMQRERALARTGNITASLIYQGMRRKYLIDSKNMEYAADVEGAKLVLHAGYDLHVGSDLLSFLALHDIDRDFRRDHPYSDKRLENLDENSKYFPEEWKDMGNYNIYNSDVLPVKLSSDRKSIVISASPKKRNQNNYYAPETMPELYARFGYMYYKNGEFEKSLEFFNQLFNIDNTNAPAYLYASYASEYLYKSTQNTKYLTQSKEFASQAYKLDPKNKYIKEQYDSL